MALEAHEGPFWFALGIGMLCSGLASAAPKPATSQPAATSWDRPVYFAARVFDPPVLDGHLDDPAWTTARPITRFLRQDGSASRFATEFRFIYDREALYASLRAVESDLPGLVLHPDKPNAVGNDDCVEFFIDADRTGRRYVQHIINAAAARLSFFCTDVGMKSRVVSASGREKDAWTLEVRFPFSELGRPPAPGDRWGLDLARNRIAKGTDSEGEYSFWSPGRVPYGTPAKFGVLVFDLPGEQTALSKQPSEAATSRLLQQIENELHRRTPWTDTDVNDDARNERARRLLGLNKLVASFPEARLLCAARPAISSEPVLPWSVPEPAAITGEIRLNVCRGEFEPVSLRLFAMRDLESVRLQVSEFRSATGKVLPAGAVDPYYVPCWYQTGVCDNYNRQVTLVDELLIKSPRLISVDLRKRKNTLNFDRIPEDAKDLQPFAIPAYESRQVWLRFHVPRDAEPGLYAGTMRIDDANGTCASVAVRLRVPAWELVPSPLLDGLYYGRRLPAKLETVEQENAAFGMMEKEIQDQIEHGCNVIGSYVHPGPLPSDSSPFATLTRINAIQQKHGIKDTPYFCVVTCAGFQSGDALKGLRDEASRLAKWAREHGRSNFVFQGRDEASLEDQKRQLPAWQAVHDGGAQMFVAGGEIDVAGKLLDFPVVVGPYRPDYARRAHALGVRVLSYAYPFTGVEMPERHRRNYGLRLYAAGYDGALNFCYGDTEEHPNPWNEFGDNNWRNTSYAYPSVTGPIDTLAFEGWREGIDDVRYAATLRKAIDEALKAGRRTQAAQSSRVWLDSLTGDEPDLDDVRDQIIHRIDEIEVGEARGTTAVHTMPAIGDHTAPRSETAITLLGVGVGRNVATETPRSAVQDIRAGRAAYEITVGGTLDAENTRTYEGVYRPGFQPNLDLIMTNTGNVPVKDPRITVNGAGDWFDMAALVRAALAGFQDGTEEEKSYALWNFCRTRLDAGPSYDGVTLWGPNRSVVRFFNCFASGACGTFHLVMPLIGDAAGLKTETGCLANCSHAVQREFYGGTDHYFDALLNYAGNMKGAQPHGYVPLELDNRTVASVKSLMDDHYLVQRLGTSPGFADHLYFGPGCDFYPSNKEGWKDPWTMGFTLRPGESLCRTWKPVEKGWLKDGHSPNSSGEGRVVFRPRLTPKAVNRDAVSVEGLTFTGAAAVADAGRAGSLVYKLRAPWMLIGAEASAHFAELSSVGSESARISISFDGNTWKRRWQAPSVGTHTARFLDRESTEFREPALTHDVWFRLEVPAVGKLTGLRMEVVFQAYAQSLPALRLGVNRIEYQDSTSEPHAVRVEHRWRESSEHKPPAAPAKPVLPPDGGEAGFRPAFEWSKSDGEIEAYEFFASPRPDCAWPVLAPCHVVVAGDTPKFTPPVVDALNEGRKYYWRVRARGKGGVWSEWSKTWSFTARGPAAPTKVKVVSENGRELLRWEAPQGPRQLAAGGADQLAAVTPPPRYEIHASSDGDVCPRREAVVTTAISKKLVWPSTLIATVDEPVLDITNRPEAFYRVVAIDGAGSHSVPTPVVSAARPRLLPATPPPLQTGRPWSWTPPTRRNAGRWVLSLRQGVIRHAADTVKFTLLAGPDWLKINAQTGELTGTLPTQLTDNLRATVQVESLGAGSDRRTYELAPAR